MSDNMSIWKEAYQLGSPFLNPKCTANIEKKPLSPEPRRQLCHLVDIAVEMPKTRSTSAKPVEIDERFAQYHILSAQVNSYI
jgi:hypothetical protein